MAPQPGMFALPYNATHKSTNQTRTEYQTDGYPQSHHHGASHQHQGNAHAGSSRAHESDSRKDKKRREFAGKLGKEMIERRDEAQIHDRMKALRDTCFQLSSRPESSSLYRLRLYPHSLKRSALLAQSANEEHRGLECVDVAYEEEKLRVEEECRTGRMRVRERLLEGLEERRKKAREEKEGEGTSGDASLDSQSRPHITRKLRNKLGTSPPPTPAGGQSSNGAHVNGSTTPPLLGGPLHNPFTLCVDDIPSPFPLPLTSPTPQAFNPYKYTVVFDPYYQTQEDKKKKKVQKFNIHGLGPAVKLFHSPEVGTEMKASDRAIAKEHEIEEDMFKLRRGTKRKRAIVHASI